MAKYQVEVTEKFYYYILVDTENEKEAKKLAFSKIDPLGMECSDAFSDGGSRIEVESVLFVEDEVLRSVTVHIPPPFKRRLLRGLWAG
jgi:hypothetical protein